MAIVGINGSDLICLLVGSLLTHTDTDTDEYLGSWVVVLQVCGMMDPRIFLLKLVMVQDRMMNTLPRLLLS